MPRLRPWYTITKGDDGRLIMHYADVAIVMRGKAVDSLFPELMPLLDGTRTIEQIVVQLGVAIEPITRSVLQQFTNSGVLLSGPRLPETADRGSAETVNFLAATLPTGDTLLTDLTTLQQLSIAVVGTSSIGAEICELLHTSGVNKVHTMSLAQALLAPITADFVLAAPSGSELPHLAAWNARALGIGMRWMQVLPFDGRFSAIGPVYVPGETSCYECFTMRRESNVGYPDEYRTLQDIAAANVTTAALEAAVAGISTMFVLRWLMRRDSSLPGRFFAFEAGGDVALVAHHVFKVPRCSACSTVARIASPSPWFDAVA